MRINPMLVNFYENSGFFISTYSRNLAWLTGTRDTRVLQITQGHNMGRVLKKSVHRAISQRYFKRLQAIFQ